VSKKLVVGDVFEVRLDALTKRFFQYVADDSTQLNSHVVRVFRKAYDVNTSPELRIVIAGEVDFHAHVLLGIGIKQQLWQRVGHAPPPSDLDVLFRDTNDYGNPSISVSTNWHVWKVNGPFERVGALRPKYDRAEVGVVVPPDSLLYRMRNGRYDFVYPGY
jgi:hypothetical protein